MIDTSPRVEDALRVSDLVPLRRMLGAHSLVLRVNPDGTLVPFEIMPALFYGRPIRQLLADEVQDQFTAACEAAIEQRGRVAFRPSGFGDDDEVMITPILADDADECRFLVCWARSIEAAPATTVGEAGLGWDDLRLDDVVVRYRTCCAAGGKVVEASPWWALPGREPIELWPHHARVAAVGLAQPVMAETINQAVEEVSGHDDGTNVRIVVPAADLFSGLVPTFAGALRTTGLSPQRVVVAIPVELAVDPDLLPVIVHLRSMGMQIDIVGLDELTATLQTVSDTSQHQPRVPRTPQPDAGPWAGTIDAATA